MILMPSYPTRLVKWTPADEQLKREVMTHFGHACACYGCGERRLEVLELDHIHGGGNAERKAMKRQGSSFYREVKTAIDQGGPINQRFLATLQPLCQTCHRSKTAQGTCAIVHVTPIDGEPFQEDTPAVTPDDGDEAYQDKLDVSASLKDRVTVRLSAADKQWLQAQPDASVSATVARLIQERRLGTRTTLDELRAFRRYQQERNGEILTLLSDLALKGSDPDPRDEVSAPSHPQGYHLTDEGIQAAEAAYRAALRVDESIPQPSRWPRLKRWRWTH